MIGACCPYPSRTGQCPRRASSLPGSGNRWDPSSGLPTPPALDECAVPESRQLGGVNVAVECDVRLWSGSGELRGRGHAPAEGFTVVPEVHTGAHAGSGGVDGDSGSQRVIVVSIRTRRTRVLPVCQTREAGCEYVERNSHMAPKVAVRVMSVEQAHERRDELIRRLPISVEELRGRAQRYDLDADELAMHDEIDDLDYLLNRA